MARNAAVIILAQLLYAFTHFNEVHPHSALRLKSPRMYRRELVRRAQEMTRIKRRPVSGYTGARSALAQGHAAATILPSQSGISASNVLNIAFDGDAVLFSDASERVFKSEGMQAFADSEKAVAKTPMDEGPFRDFLAALHRIQSTFSPGEAPIRTALVTARAVPAHERVIRTLRACCIRIDDALFLGGMPKGDFLKAFGADIFFDDQTGHCASASLHVPTGHVPFGIANEIGST